MVWGANLLGWPPPWPGPFLRSGCLTALGGIKSSVLVKKGRNQFGWKREEIPVLEPSRKRFEVSEVWQNLERKENVYRSEDPVPFGKQVNWGCCGRGKAGEPGHWGTGQEGGDLVSAGAFGVRQSEMGRQERMPGARGTLGWVGGDPTELW